MIGRDDHNLAKTGRWRPQRRQKELDPDSFQALNWSPCLAWSVGSGVVP